MGCIVSKLFLDFYIFFIFTRPLSQILTKIQMFKVRILRIFSDGIKTSFSFASKFVLYFFLQGEVIGSNILLIAGV